MCAGSRAITPSTGNVPHRQTWHLMAPGRRTPPQLRARGRGLCGTREPSRERTRWARGINENPERNHDVASHLDGVRDRGDGGQPVRPSGRPPRCCIARSPPGMDSRPRRCMPRPALRRAAIPLRVRAPAPFLTVRLCQHERCETVFADDRTTLAAIPKTASRAADGPCTSGPLGLPSPQWRCRWTRPPRRASRSTRRYVAGCGLKAPDRDRPDSPTRAPPVCSPARPCPALVGLIDRSPARKGRSRWFAPWSRSSHLMTRRRRPRAPPVDN